MTITTPAHPWRTDEPFSQPFWWEDRQLAQHFAGVSDAQLTHRLEHLLKNPPADTGLEPGLSREWHCLQKVEKCDLCKAWIAWDDEATAIMREQHRRRAARR